MSIKNILMDRDGLTDLEADQMIGDAKAELFDLLTEGDEESAYDICATWFGLEPDYIDELMY